MIRGAGFCGTRLDLSDPHPPLNEPPCPVAPAG